MNAQYILIQGLELYAAKISKLSPQNAVSGTCGFAHFDTCEWYRDPEESLEWHFYTVKGKYFLYAMVPFVSLLLVQPCINLLYSIVLVAIVGLKHTWSKIGIKKFLKTQG